MTEESRHILAADGTRLHVRLSRGGSELPSCLLIHGSGDGAFVWSALQRVLLPACSIAAVDLRGHGDSAPSVSKRYDLTVHVSDVLTIVRTLGLRRLIIVGHSLGGRIAIQLAAALLSAQTVAAVLVDICPDPNPAACRQVAERLRDGLRNYASPDHYASWLLETRPLMPAATAAELALAALREVDGHFVPKLDPEFVNRDRGACEYSIEEWRRLLRGIACPTLLVRGAGSAMVSHTSAQSMLSLLQQGKLTTIQRAGHAVMTDNPEDFGRAVTGFIQSLRGLQPASIT